MKKKVVQEELKKNRKCEVCFKIICGGCGWEPDDDEVLLIQKEIITECIKCGWKPSPTRSRLV